MKESGREFILYSRKGPTAPFGYREGLERRMDLVARAVISALFLSHRLRDASISISLNGPPRPPMLVEMNSKIERLSPNEKSVMEWISKAVSNLGVSINPGIVASRKSFQEVVREKAEIGKDIFVLHERGIDISEANIGKDAVFIIGDHIGLPEKEERFAMRFATKVSIGPNPYLASSVISFINIWMDRMSLE